MPKYFFDITENDQNFPDPTGQEFPNDHSAHREAVRTIADLAAEEIPKDGKLHLVIAVKDETDRILFKTHVRFEPGEE